MKLQYLGTAAAEGIPAIFCECEVCKRSKILGGRNIRTRSQALVDGCILLDFPADTYAHALAYNIPMEEIETCLITHSHHDHLYTAELEYRKDGFGHIYNGKCLTFYSDTASYDIIKSALEEAKIPEKTVNAVLITPFVPFEVQGYTVTALRAEHTRATSPVIFLIEKNGKIMLYSHDSGLYPEETVEYLRHYGKHIDLVSADCTEGNKHIDYLGHNNLQRNIITREQLDSFGITDKNTLWVLNHFSHNGGHDGGVVIYDEFVEIAQSQGFVTAYDGLEIEF